MPTNKDAEYVLGALGFRRYIMEDRSGQYTYGESEGQHDAPYQGPLEGEQSFESELTHLVNKYNIDNALNTPDFVIAAALNKFLPLLAIFNVQRDRWWGFVPEIGNPHVTGAVNKGAEPNFFNGCYTFPRLIDSFADYAKDFSLMTADVRVKIHEDAVKRAREIASQRAHDDAVVDLRQY